MGVALDRECVNKRIMVLYIKGRRYEIDLNKGSV